MGRPGQPRPRGSAEVRRLVLDSVRGWFTDFHVDGLRLDAVHALVDESRAPPAGGDGRPRWPRWPPTPASRCSSSPSPTSTTRTSSRPREGGGYGLDAQWSDDFHHALHVALTGETEGYYADFEPLGALAKVLRARLLPRRDLVVLPRSRPRRPARRRPGARLAARGGEPEPRPGRQPRPRRPADGGLDDDRLAVAALVTLTSPFTPMLFMGEEWGASTPFAFFTSHPEPDLGRAVSRGPARRVRADGWDTATVPDPQDPATFDVLDGWTGRSGRRRAAGRCWRATAGWPTCAAPCPRSPTPTCARSTVDHDEDARWLVYAGARASTGSWSR